MTDGYNLPINTSLCILILCKTVKVTEQHLKFRSSNWEMNINMDNMDTNSVHQTHHNLQSLSCSNHSWSLYSLHFSLVFFFFRAALISGVGMFSFLRFCKPLLPTPTPEPTLRIPPAPLPPLGPRFFFSALSFSSSSWFSRSMSVMSVLHRRWSSIAVRDLINQSKRNWGAIL